MDFIYYGHSCFGVTVAGKKLVFDPFITPNERTRGILKLEDIRADYILLSHGHEDHVADAVQLARSTGATVIANWEIHEWLQQQGITHTHPMNTGGKRDFGPFQVKCVNALHSSGLPDGSYGGNPMGFIVLSPQGNFYYSGDTGLSLDMQLIPRWAKLNFAVLPIGDNFTMDASDAAQCAEWIQCKQIVGVHYDTFGYITLQHEAARKAFAEKGITLHLLEIGETQSFI
ncbi:MAG: metal-dependent hydrolase [Chitinophagaceae bacterium]